ncbi:helix-turn-helix protein [Actinomadura pelletieri DSM 43383]|uniref:Helix-turn-helix protein n=1 Tax=Actinomadura pelletieri DSM 43383 TaxID=1120940 RepID=A0A495QMQ4_9ACTN|nr:helix-turn-helix transcriptional regulator [Actinomadura pelletieri]RKS74265.1 helix-turn-helix protein [Actinomadura pelletieri DSM 43383]
MASPTSGRRHEELRDFLRTRRARLTPADVGMPDGGRRRTPGLRREEAAVLAGVGVSWYTWLEQGRDIKVSGDVLDAIARALRLDEAERVHLYLLAGLNPPPAEAEPIAQVTPELQRLLDAWSPRPAYIRDRYWNLIAYNDMAREVFGYVDTDHNCLVIFFTSVRYRGLHPHWSAVARDIVGRFRAEAARYPEDPEFARIADDLMAVSPEFAELWQRHEVSAGTQAVKAIRHPVAGDLIFDSTVLPIQDRPGQGLVLYNPRPGTGTLGRLERLATRPGLAAAG